MGLCDPWDIGKLLIMLAVLFYEAKSSLPPSYPLPIMSIHEGWIDSAGADSATNRTGKKPSTRSMG